MTPIPRPTDRSARVSLDFAVRIRKTHHTSLKPPEWAESLHRVTRRVHGKVIGLTK